MSSTPSSHPGSPSLRWWIAGLQGAEGPYEREQLEQWLQTKQLQKSVLVCPEGGGQWLPVYRWPQFAAVVGSWPAPPPLPPSHGQPAQDRGLLTNWLLPPMANAICVYCIAVVPVLISIGLVSLLLTGGLSAQMPESAELAGVAVLLDLFTILVSFGVGGMLIVGGVKLRDLRRSGPTLIKAAVCINVVCLALMIVAALTLFALAPVEDAANSPPASPVEDLIIFFEGTVSLVAFCFELVALVWLIRRGNELPLHSAQQYSNPVRMDLHQWPRPGT